MKSIRRVLAAAAALGCSLAAFGAASVPFPGLHWRSIGPFRAGWATCIEGIPDRPDVFYFGAAVGGVWRSDDAGRTWSPLFQNERTASVDAVAIAPSNPDVIYVGTGQVETRYDIPSGRGVYRSDDAGKTWRHLGLEATRAVGRILVDPKNPDVALAAALGHIFGPNPDRGVYRTDDGGRTWKKTLFVDENTGAVDLAADPRNPAVVYASTWQARNYPWLSYFQPNIGPGSGIYKSEDEGRTWKRVSGGGWPAGNLGRIGLSVASSGRVWAAVAASSSSGNFDLGAEKGNQTGLYRSDDGGATWTLVSSERWIGSDYFGRVTADPQNPDVVYMTGQSIRRSTDGGKTFEVFKGAPGGDDYHFVWINPKHPDHIATGSDQGAVVSVNGGKTWSSWYNQPTGQFYHVEADDRFPYWVYSGQQDSGTVGVASRSDYGAISFREWHPVGGDERDYDVPDPGDPMTIYASGLGGNLRRFDTRTGQSAAIDPNVVSVYAQRATTVKYRYTWITPIAVSRREPHAVYEGAQVLFRSRDRGQSWEIVSPDLSRAVPGTAGCDGAITVANAAPCGFGVIFSIALSPRSDDDIWIGTDDGLIQRTRDGGRTWTNVTPQGLPVWSKVASLDVSALDPETAYAAIDRQRLDDFTPHAYRTHDGGRTWTSITAGLPGDDFVDVVRADPDRRGLLYAGTGAGVFVSFDDGDRWQPLQLDLPTTWIRDLLVHGNDLIAATQGRGIWILDDVSPLRQAEAATASTAAHLFRPADAYRLRRSENADTPLPPETPLGENPPAGAVIDYWLGSAAPGPVVIEILDDKGALVRRYSSEDRPESIEAMRYFAAAWLKPADVPSREAGHHRFVWDLRYPRPKAGGYEYSIAAIWGKDTPAEPEGALAAPGKYTIRLTAAGRTETQPLVVRMDPRIPVPPEAIARQLDVALDAAEQMERSFSAAAELGAYRKRLAPPSGPPLEKTAAERLAPFEGRGGFARLNRRFASVFQAVESADNAPTAQALSELQSAKSALEALLARWKELDKK
ncbi:MAG TPA: glycoside hydrolase [Thermoanaerobaculia bacterium]|nr:glycoside hydrolase [Thermoanaerobaculia bacterium]